MKKTYTKKFEFKGQQINYFRKLLAQSDKFSYIGKYTNTNGEFFVEYRYA